MTSVINLPWFRCLQKALFISLFVCSAILPCAGQQQFFAQPSAFATIPGLAGPTKVSLGDLAEIAVPKGCKFIEPGIARTLLDRTGNPAPQNLAGLIVPENGRWFSILQLSLDGYVSDKDRNRLNPAAILKTIRGDLGRQNEENAKLGAPAVPDASWLFPPAYDATNHTLQYALQTSGSAGGSINCVATLLGRRGVLSLTTVLPLQPNPDLASLSEILKGFSFNAGERYADHRPEDRMASSGLVELVSNSNGATIESKYSVAAFLDIAIWAGAAIAFLVSAWFLISLSRRKQKARYYRVEAKYARAAPVLAATAAAQNGHAQAASANGHTLPASNGKLRRNGHRRRRKLFSYHAFYSDMVMNLTSCGYSGSPVSFNGEHSNGFAQPAPAANGHNGHNGAAMPEATKILVTETSKLIESQQKLIEGQRKLIEAQSKLIHEKSMLLNAETKMLEKQSDLLGEQQLL